MPRSRITRQPLHAWLILAVGLILTLYLTHEVKQRTQSDAVERFAFAADQVTLRIEERLGTYALMLRSASGLFDASEDVTREEWRVYWDKLRVSPLISGVQGIGFAQLIPPEALASHIAEVRAQGFDDYTVSPPGPRDVYSAIVYLEPFAGRNLRAFGYDMFSEPVRRAAMAKARDTGMASLSGKVELVQETGVDVQPGTLMYVPVYAQGAPTDTVAQRRAALIGWTYSPYRMNDLMEGILGNWERLDGQGVGLRLYDGNVAAENLLFRNHDHAQARPPSLFHQQRSIDFNGHVWALEFDHLDPANGLSYTATWATLIGGTALTGLLFALLFNLSNTQARALRIADQLTLQIREREAELRDSESRWRFAIEGAGDGLWDWKLADDSVFFSPQWKAMLGYADEEIGNRLEEWETRVHPEDKDRTLAEVQACLEGDALEYVSEHRMRCKDGSWKWILDRGMVLSRDADGRPLRMIGTHTDVTAYKELESERERLLQRLQTLTNRVPGMVYEYQLFPDGRTCFPYASEAIRQVYEVSPDQVRDNAAPVLEILHPDDAQRVMNSILASARDLSPWRLEYRVRFKDGRVRWLYGDALPHREADGSTLWYGFITDITERKEAEIELLAAHAEAERFREALDYVSSYIYMKDTASRYTYANRATLELFGCDQASLPGSDDDRFFPPTTARRLREIDRRVFAGEQTSEEVETVNAHGQYRVYLEIKTPIRDESDPQHIIGLLGISTDITQIKEHERQLEHIAHYDALTNLPNRVLLADRLNRAMAQARRRDRHLAVVYLDLDGFKAINDRHGHAIGDKMLMAVSRNMLGALREEDTLSRLGGDEFVAVLLDLDDTEACVPMITRLLEAAASPMRIDGQALQVSASVGVTFYPQAEEIEAEQLLRQADQAMYQAKLAGKGRYHLFDAEMDRSVRSHNEHLERLRSALLKQELVLYYQPKVNMRSGKVIGAEALIRWQHPERGLLPPADFLSIIEDSHLAIEVGEWVIRSALQQMQDWRTLGLELPVSINVSARQLRQGDFVERLASLLAEQPDIPASMLELEVLETSALGDLIQISLLLERCRALGVGVSLDDFGTGYSSLTYLKRLPAGTVKVDQSFIRDILLDPEDLAILDGVMNLAQAFNREVIAEGVETVEHGDMLLRIGCEQAQGYGIARPMPAAEIPAWCQGWRPEPHWPSLRRLSREAMPLLYAGVEHQAWVHSLESALRSGETRRPPLDAHQCHFGQWLDRSGFVNQPGFGKVDLLHRQVHQLARELCELQDQGQGDEALERLHELHGLRDQLIKALGVFID